MKQYINKVPLFFSAVTVVVFLFFLNFNISFGQGCDNTVIDACKTNTTCYCDSTQTKASSGYFTPGLGGSLQVVCGVFQTTEQSVSEYDSCLGQTTVISSCSSPQVSTTQVGQDVCDSNNTCGNGSKDPYECCDGGSDCNLNCTCVVSTQNEISTFCGDNICGSGENAGNCPQDCSVACVLSSITPEGPQNIVVHQGDTNFIGAEFGYTAGPVNYDFFGCPPNATCSGETGTVDVGQFDPQEVRVYMISPSAATPPGIYPILGRFYDPDNFTCQYSIRYNVKVLASRKVVCDGSWNEMPGSYGVVNEFNVSGFGASLGNFVNAKTVDFAYKASRDFYTQKCSYGLAGFGDTCTWNTVYNVSRPNPANVGITETPYLSYGGVWPYLMAHLRYGNETWFMNYNGSVSNIGDVAMPWGTQTTVTDPAGRTFSFRFVYNFPNSYYEYRCNDTPSDLTVNNLNTIGALSIGTNLGFQGRVNNTVPAVPDSQARLRIDIGNNGSWDITPATQGTGPLGDNGGETVIWNNVWVATAGTHLYEVCADTTGVVTESDENNNCTTAIFVISAPLQPNLTVDNLNTIGSLTSGTSLGFTGRVTNPGTAAAGASQARLRIDLSNDGSWDITVNPNQSTAALAINANETETWNNAWIAISGTHKFEICADILGSVSESDEADNCINSAPFTINPNPPGPGPTYNSKDPNPPGVPAVVPCERVRITWVDNSSDETGFKIYKDGQYTGITTAANTTYLDFNPGDNSPHTYQYSAVSGALESALANATNNPYSSISCNADLSSSDKDITAFNGSSNSTQNCFGGSEVPANTAYKIGDTIRFAINMCNSAPLGGGNATNIYVVDTLVNLERVDKAYAIGATVDPRAYNASVTGGLTISNIQVVSGSEPGNLVLRFNLSGSIAPGAAARLIFEAKTALPSSFTGQSSRFQNSARINYLSNGVPSVKTVQTPLLLLTKGQAPNREEIAP